MECGGGGGQVSFTISICLSAQLRPNRDRKGVSDWECWGCGEGDSTKCLSHVDLPCILIFAAPPPRTYEPLYVSCVHQSKVTELTGARGHPERR